jgi:hypothetical protein
MTQPQHRRNDRTGGQQVQNYLVPSGTNFPASVSGTTPVDEYTVKPEDRKALPERRHALRKTWKLCGDVTRSVSPRHLNADPICHDENDRILRVGQSSISNPFKWKLVELPGNPLPEKLNHEQQSFHSFCLLRGLVHNGMPAS